MNQRVPQPLPQGRGFGFAFGGGPHGGRADSLEWVIFALLLVLILLVIAQLALSLTRRKRFGGRHLRRGLHGPPGPPGGGPFGRPDPLAVAGLRYARGEIGRDEYLRLAQDLGGAGDAGPPPPPPA
jgi:uncharacterized membrane protein